MERPKEVFNTMISMKEKKLFNLLGHGLQENIKQTLEIFLLPAFHRVGLERPLDPTPSYALCLCHPAHRHIVIKPELVVHYLVA